MQKFLNIFKKNKSYKAVLVCVSCILLVVGLFLSLTQIRNFNISNTIVTYKVRSSKLMLTKVKLQDNDLFTNDSEGYYSSHGGFYVANLVDDIVVNFYDTLYLTDIPESSISATKSVTATLIVVSEEGQILQEVKSGDKPGYISQSTEKYENANQIVLNQSTELDYQSFYDRFAVIKSKLTGVSCTAYIRVNYILNCSGIVNGETFSYNDTLTSNVPVQNSGTFAFENSYKSSTEIVKDDTVIINEANYVAIVFGVIFALVGIAGITIDIIIFCQSLNENKSKKYISKILYTFGDIIVLSKTPTPLDKEHIITVENFDDLLKVETELSKPIILNHNENIYEFYVLATDLLYYWKFDENQEMEQ